MKIYLISIGVLLVVGLAIFISLSSILNKINVSKSNHKPCPVVKQDAVPFAVLSAFRNKFPFDTVITWFNKDNRSYCAYFETKNFVDKLVQFNNSGTFINEETDIKDDDDFKDSTGAVPVRSKGCICETVDMN